MGWSVGLYRKKKKKEKMRFEVFQGNFTKEYLKILFFLFFFLIIWRGPISITFKYSTTTVTVIANLKFIFNRILVFLNIH